MRRLPKATASQLEVDGLTIRITPKRVKNINLRVQPPLGDVHLSVPVGTSEAAVRSVVRERRTWIDRHRRKFRQLPRPLYRDYVDGECINVLGEALTLRFVTGKRQAKSPDSSTAGSLTGVANLTIAIPLGANRELRKRAVERRLRLEAKHRFAAEVARWEPRLGVTVAQLGIKRMKTRWGTCNPTAGRVWLNLALIERPARCLEYVVVHELAHLLVADHSPAFWAVVERQLPDFRSSKALLARHPLWLDAATDDLLEH